MIVHFLRHGQTPSSRDHLFSGREDRLTERGQEMANAVAQAYRAAEIERIVTSGLPRTNETAQPLSQITGVRIEERPGWRELEYGSWTGRNVDAVAVEEADAYRSWSDDPVAHPPAGGDSAQAIAESVARELQHLRNTSRGGVAFVVSHKATIRIALCLLMGMDVRLFRKRLACPEGSISTVAFGEDGPTLLRLADVSHLSDR